MNKDMLSQVLQTIELQVANLQRQADAIRAELARHEPTTLATVPAEPVKRPNRPNQRLGGRPRTFKTCTIEGCRAEHVALGMCGKHYAAHVRAERRMQQQKVNQAKPVTAMSS
jgi:hypothetical protein